MSEAVAAPRRRNPVGVVALAFGILSNIGAALAGFFLTGLNAVIYLLPVGLFGLLAIVLGVIGLVLGTRPGAAKVPSILAILCGVSPLIVWAVGGWLGNVFIR